QVATSHADEVWVTNDNPRSENPLEIIQEICRGAPTAQVEANRALAITQALMSASEKDVILVAGKGHETYQEIAGIRHPFIDGKQVAQALAVRTKNGGNP
ncbi:MAG: glutamate ligase domain-containing protein, partial [Azovibrio sp.]